MSDLISDRLRLRSAPSESLWELEIRRILVGQRALEMHRLGGVEEYVEIILSDSSDHAEARTTFLRALRIVVNEVRFQDWRKRSTAACLLDLIGAYLPPPGFAKVLAALQGGELLQGDLFDDNLYPGPRDLHLKALFVLTQYFQSPPISGEAEPAFRQLVALLRGHLSDHPYASFALLRLLELGVVKLKSDEFRIALTRSSDTIADLVTYLGSPSPTQRSEGIVSALYLECLSLGVTYEAHFQSALRDVDAEFLNTDEGSAIRWSDATVLQLELPWTTIALATSYMESRHLSEAARGYLKLGIMAPEGIQQH